MDDAALVRELDREAHVDERAQQRLHRPALAELVVHRHADEPLHREVRRAVGVDVQLVHGDDGRVIEPRLDARLAKEPRDRRRVLGAALHALDRDLAADARVRRREDLAHATLADQLAHPIAGRRR